MKSVYLFSSAFITLFSLFSFSLLIPIKIDEGSIKPVRYGNGERIQIWTCSDGPNQRWVYSPQDKTIRLRADATLCLDIDDYGKTDGSAVWLYSCHTDDKDPNHQNQEWNLQSDGTITSTMSGKCLEVINSSPDDGAGIQIWTCGGSPNQKWKYSSQTGSIASLQTGKCLDVGDTIQFCNGSASSFPFCNPSVPMSDRVQDLLQLLTVDEKISLLQNTAAMIPRLSIPAYQWWSEALHGVGNSPGVTFDKLTPFATCFPQVIGLGASFNMRLVYSIATAISDEARAFANVGHAGLTFWAPNVNIFRDPRWGRGQETPGEDPYLTSQYVQQFVRGMQEGDDPRYLKVSSCCKHFTAYDLENWHGVDRHHFDAVVTDQDLRETYLPPFHTCVEEGRVSCIMCSYNEVNGVPSCTNKETLKYVIRDGWNFNGYITGDCGAVDDVLNTHHYTSTPEDTCAAVLNATMDVDCGKLKMVDVDNALTNLIQVQMRLGLFDPASDQPYRKIPTSVINSPAHQDLALQAARESIVLLQNNDKTLPLSASTTKTIAVVGPNAKATETMQGNYFGVAPYLISVFDGLQNYASVKYAKGCDINSDDTSGFDQAVSLAQTANATVIVVGLDQSIESEGADRTSLVLPGVQEKFVLTVAAAANGPVILVLMAGGPVDISNLKDIDNLKTILWVGYPGQSGGRATADVIFGAYNPGGRLPYTVYPASYASQVSMFDMNMRPNTTRGSPGRTYKFYQDQAVFEFGHGLSYTTFSYGFSKNSVHFSYKQIASHLSDQQNPIRFPIHYINVTVTNTGDRDGDDVVLLFIAPPNPGQGGNPLKVLIGFDRVSLKSGQTTTLSFPLESQNLSIMSTKGVKESQRGKWSLIINKVYAHSIIVE